MRSQVFPRVAGALIFIASATVVVACGGGAATSYSGQPIPTPAAVLSGSITTSTTSSVTLPNVGVPGLTVGGTLPSANVATTLTETVSLNAPSGVTPLAKHRETAEPSPSPVAYVTFSSTASVTLSAIPALTFTSASISSSNTYYLALYTGTGWEGPVSGPGTVTGDSVSFTTATGTVPITPTQPAIIALVATTSALPSSSPSASPGPSAMPNQLAFDESSPAPQTFTVAETGYSGAFTESTSCTASPAPSPVPTTDPFVAQVSPSTATPTSAGGSVTFTVTPGEETGSCTITVSDSNAQTTTVSIAVALDQVIIYDRKRH